MSSAAGTESRTLVDRAKAILMKPKEEWPVIAAEKTEIAALYNLVNRTVSALGVELEDDLEPWEFGLQR